MAVNDGTGSSPVLNMSGGGTAMQQSAPANTYSTMATNFLTAGQTDQFWAHQSLWMGWKRDTHSPRNFGGAGHAVEDMGGVSHSRSPILVTPFALLQRFDKMSHKDYLVFKNRLVAAGMIDSSADPETVRAKYEDTLKNLQLQQQVNGVMMSPEGYINNMIRLNGFDPSKISGSASFTGQQPKTYTQTQKSVYDMDPSSAHLMMEQMLAEKLGRAPSHAEIQDFVDAVKTRAQDDPSTSTTTYHTDAEGNTTSSTVSHSGFGADDAQLIAERRAKNAPDYAKYQSAAVYFPALVSALGATTG